eukprot:CAMPEP_0184322092 /NCGR_PEP_ID=MMETSP1049-20130417/122801_1 /TAXON_ID=77928 /ORGANISM="Proteomonas sulcata, Strain CCMP704" /LENGTH=215 /DNA_ID=CAMNT_0026643115 /DNA_START=493 /DNA_END=1142 /DNA_ORIENTATION=+
MLPPLAVRRMVELRFRFLRIRLAAWRASAAVKDPLKPCNCMPSLEVRGTDGHVWESLALLPACQGATQEAGPAVVPEFVLERSVETSIQALLGDADMCSPASLIILAPESIAVSGEANPALSFHVTQTTRRPQLTQAQPSVGDPRLAARTYCRISSGRPMRKYEASPLPRAPRQHHGHLSADRQIQDPYTEQKDYSATYSQPHVVLSPSPSPSPI